MKEQIYDLFAAFPKGKTGGGRIITYGVSKETRFLLLLIYDKSKYETLSDAIR